MKQHIFIDIFLTDLFKNIFEVQLYKEYLQYACFFSVYRLPSPGSRLSTKFLQTKQTVTDPIYQILFVVVNSPFFQRK